MNETFSRERALGIVVMLVVAGIIICSLVKPVVDTATYQSIYITGNQQYFGKLHALETDMPYLTDIYYVSQQNPTLPTEQVQNFRLVKLGGEIHGPEDLMYINKDHLLFWHNLRQNSEVVQGILKEKAQRQQAQQMQRQQLVAPATPPAMPESLPAK